MSAPKPFVSAHNVEFVSSPSQKTFFFFYHIAADREPSAAPGKRLVLVFVPLIAICCLSSTFFKFTGCFFVCLFVFCCFFYGRDCVFPGLHNKNSACLLPALNQFFFFSSSKFRGRWEKKKTEQKLVQQLHKRSASLTLTRKLVFPRLPLPTWRLGILWGFGAQPAWRRTLMPPCN